MSAAGQPSFPSGDPGRADACPLAHGDYTAHPGPVLQGRMEGGRAGPAHRAPPAASSILPPRSGSAPCRQPRSFPTPRPSNSPAAPRPTAGHQPLSRPPSPCSPPAPVPGCAGSRPEAPPTPAGTRRPKPWRWQREGRKEGRTEEAANGPGTAPPLPGTPPTRRTGGRGGGRVMLRHTMPYHAMPYCTMPCHAMPCYALLCSAMPALRCLRTGWRGGGRPGGFRCCQPKHTVIDFAQGEAKGVLFCAVSARNL